MTQECVHAYERVQETGRMLEREKTKERDRQCVLMRGCQSGGRRRERAESNRAQSSLTSLLISPDLTFENLPLSPPPPHPLFPPPHPLTPSAVMCVNPALPLNRLNFSLALNPF